MGHVARQSYTVPDGKGGRVTRHSRKWYCFFRPPGGGPEKRVPGYSDKRATEQLLAKLERQAAQIHAGLIPPPAESDVLRRPLADWLTDYLAERQPHITPESFVRIEARLRRTLDEAGWKRLADAQPGSLERYLAGLRAGGSSAGTANVYLRTTRTFITWLSRRAKLLDPLTGLRGTNEQADRRHVRRALTEAEFRLLVEIAEASGEVVLRQDGPARALLYLCAGYTGLRESELGRLTPGHLDLTAGTVSLAAAETKGRRKAVVLPLHPQLCRRLAAWVQRPHGLLQLAPSDLASSPLWPGTWWRGHGAQLLRRDLDAAGIPYRDGRGRVFDFHALRGQFVTSLARAGVSLVVAQRLARHSNPTLTAMTYTQLEQDDLRAGVDQLPPLPEPRRSA
jgi:integrase